MVRVVRVGEALQVGRTLPGRGAWLCAGSPSCLDLAVRRRALGRALRGPVGEAGLDQVRAAVAAGSPAPPPAPGGTIGDAGDDRRHW